jgi:murein L,D-transpeptidase YcbB/YkuD
MSALLAVRSPIALIVILALGVAGLAGAPAKSEVTALKQAIAEAASRDKGLASIYRAREFSPVWTGPSEEHLARRAQLLRFLDEAPAHGLPPTRYRADSLRYRMARANSPRDLGTLDVELSRVFLRYARDIQTGILKPGEVDRKIFHEVPYRDRADLMHEFIDSEPAAFLRRLPPQTVEYAGLMKEKLRLEDASAKGGWGAEVPLTKLEPGDSGPRVAALRDRLIAMGYLRPTHSQRYDKAMQDAIEAFQTAHGLKADGVAGEETLREINRPISARLKSVIVAMERERWTNSDTSGRHIIVNIPDFSAKIIDNGKVTFRTRAVVGANKSGRQTPEFSDVMEHMVINPSWYVPRSIIVNEYLPKLRANPGAVRHLQITDRSGRVVSRSAANFAGHSARSFPYSMRQPPGPKNALGLVKFMFPNVHNIYLHDTPAKHLFERESRAYSHGCIRLAEPFEFAYALLSRQSARPRDDFHNVLDTGRETRVPLDQTVPVHIIYRTAFLSSRGRMEYRRDIYGRDARIWEALSDAGLALTRVQG